MRFSTIVLTSLIAVGLFVTGHLLMSVGMAMVVITLLLQSLLSYWKV